MTLEERIKNLKESINEIDAINEECEEFDLSVPIENSREALKIINELQQKNDLLQLDLTAAQEIMGCMNKEKAELIKALNYIRSCDSSTESAAKAIEMLKKYE